MAWTLTPTIVETSRNYIKWRLQCKNDANALSATDIFSETYMPRDLKGKLQGLTYMKMKIDPSGPDATSLSTTINVTISDSEGDSIYTTTGNSASAISWHDLSTDIGAYPTFFERMYIAVNDLGDAGVEEFYLYFYCWKEPGAS